MPAREDSYLVQGPDGTWVTVTARTNRGALRRYLVNYPRVQGLVAVKLRGSQEIPICYKVDR